MKKVYIFLFTVLMGVLACNDEFTETPAIGALSDEALQSALGVDLKLTAAYSALDGKNLKNGNDWYSTGDNWWFDVISDDAHKGSTDGDQADLFLLETLDWNTGNDYLLGKWIALYSGVNRANSVLSLIKGIEESGNIEGDFSGQKAEATFLRGFFNFQLVQIFGNVPFISVENFDAIEFSQPNPGPIWDQIEADFQFAMDVLPEIQDDVGRPTKWTARAFLGKVLLFQSKWSEAFALLDNVVTAGPYELIPEYVDNFRLAGDNSSETIFSIQFTADDGQSFNGNRGGTLNFPAAFGWCCGFYQPSQDLVNAYQTENGLPLLDTFNQTDVKNDYGITSSEPFTPETGPLDPRLDYAVGRRGMDYNGWGENVGKAWVRANFADISGPYIPKKNVFYNGEDANQGTGSWGQWRTGINFHLMRYADLLLMAAEAAVETGDLPTALDYVNRVRLRAKNMTYLKDVDGSGDDAANYEIELYTSFPDQDFARKAVRMERRLELAMEGKRLFDIRRWGNGTTIMNEYFVNEARVITSFAGKARPYDSKNDLMPIPITAIDQSGGVLVQNPGY
jgi:starch-binding outer membrane protein, SusD/RagB family